MTVPTISTHAGTTAATDAWGRWILRVGGACLLTGALLGAVTGALIVLITWYPGALATYASNPQFLDPASVVGLYCAWAATIGATVGLTVGAVIVLLRGIARAQASPDAAA